MSYEEDGSKSWNVETIYSNPVYMIVFWIKNLFTAIMFAAGMYSAIRVAHPNYFKPAKWYVQKA